MKTKSSLILLILSQIGAIALLILGPLGVINFFLASVLSAWLSSLALIFYSYYKETGAFFRERLRILLIYSIVIVVAVMAVNIVTTLLINPDLWWLAFIYVTLSLAGFLAFSILKNRPKVTAESALATAIFIPAILAAMALIMLIQVLIIFMQSSKSNSSSGSNNPNYSVNGGIDTTPGVQNMQGEIVLEGVHRYLVKPNGDKIPISDYDSARGTAKDYSGKTYRFDGEYTGKRKKDDDGYNNKPY